MSFWQIRIFIVNHQNGDVGSVEISVVEGAHVKEVSAPISPGTKSMKKTQEPLKGIFAGS